MATRNQHGGFDLTHDDVAKVVRANGWSCRATYPVYRFAGLWMSASSEMHCRLSDGHDGPHCGLTPDNREYWFPA